MTIWGNILQSIFDESTLQAWNKYAKTTLMLAGSGVGLLTGLLLRDAVPENWMILFVGSTTGLGAVVGYEISKLASVGNLDIHTELNVQGQYYADGTKTGYPINAHEGEMKLLVDITNREGPYDKYDRSLARSYSGQKDNHNYIDNFMNYHDESIWKRVKKWVDMKNGTAAHYGQIAGVFSHSLAPWVGKAFFETYDPHGTGIADGAWMDRAQLIDWYLHTVPNTPDGHVGPNFLWCNKPYGNGHGNSYGGDPKKGMWDVGIFAPCRARTNAEYPECQVPILGAKPACPSLTKSPYPFRTVAADGDDWF